VAASPPRIIIPSPSRPASKPQSIGNPVRAKDTYGRARKRIITEAASSRPRPRSRTSSPPLSDRDTPRLVVIDSIQTMWTDAVESAPGTVTQVRGAAQAQIRFAKRSGAALILVGHVTKDG
jgi:hypothetical protein